MKRISLQFLFAGLVAASSLPANLAFSQTDVVQAAKDAGKTFAPIAAQDVAAAKAELQAATVSRTNGAIPSLATTRTVCARLDPYRIWYRAGSAVAVIRHPSR